MNVATKCHLLVHCEKATSNEVTITVTNPGSRAVWRIDGVRPVWTQMGTEQVASFIVERYIHDHYSRRNDINFVGLQSAVARVLPLSGTCTQEEEA